MDDTMDFGSLSAEDAPMIGSPAEVPTEPRRYLADLIGLGSALTLCLFVLIANVTNHYALSRLDILTFYIPWYEHLGDRLRHFDIPGWLPFTMSGVPFAGDPQSGWGYLPAMISFAIAPSNTGYVIYLVFHMVLACAGAYLFARIIGMGVAGAVMVSIAFSMGNLNERFACCTIHMQVAVWMPAILLFIELGLRTTTTRRRLIWYVLAGIGLGQMMAGWVGQGAYYAGLGVGAYALFRLVWHHQGRWLWRRQLVQLVVGGFVLGVIALATVIPAVVPRLDTIGRSNLSNLYEGAVEPEGTGWLIQEFPFEAFSYMSGTATSYLGVALMIVTVAGAVGFYRRPRAAYFIGMTAVVLTLVARTSPVEWVFNLLPQFKSLHIHSPERIYVVLFLGPAVLAGWLVDGIVERRPERRIGPFHAVLVVQAALAVAATILVVTWDQVGAWIRTDRIELGIACLVLVLLGLLAKWPAVRWSCAIGLILLVLWDPALDRVESRHASPGNTAKLGRFVSQSQNPGGAVTWLLEQQQSDPYFRYFGYDVMQLMNNGRARTYHITYSDPKTIRLVAMNRSVYFGLNDIQGYNPVQIKRYVEFMNTLNAAEQSYHAANVLEGGLDSPLLNILGVRYIVVPAEVPPERPDLLHLSQRYKTVYQDASVRILENPAALPRAWMVHDVKQVEDADRLLTRLALHLDDPTETVLLQDSPPTLEPAVAGAAEQVTITSYSADEIRLTVNASSTGMVVLSEIWDPGWSATVDGQDAEVWAADYALRGIVVGPGTHEVVLRYDATIVKRSLLAWFVPLFALVGLCIPWPDRRRRTWAEAEPTEADIWA